ncbi:DUF1934 domain-containing protein [Anaerovorax odorimutans]|uniref:DUF1934 domain-containing protein n=1 Tax=Anaerovorax odorimutans TaxID=109327 RepID=A0ABT1RQH2_9FIRM|nr:DUF1934 domain-containing protein [Anaerovorax odorimutans]MCQ4637443.1 DUF1934 domain-containing protein [Anaerovorax odorimutans]
MKNIMMKIIGTQVTADLEEDQLEFITEGKLYQRGDALYLIYDESEISGMPGCRTRLKLKNGTIKMKRVGENVGLDTEIEFEKGKRYTGYYDTPFGAIEMEVLTNHVENSVTAEGKGSLDIDYHISLKGLVEGRNKLNIELM